jgi:hypothetical protein
MNYPNLDISLSSLDKENPIECSKSLMAFYFPYQAAKEWPKLRS